MKCGNAVLEAPLKPETNVSGFLFYYQEKKPNYQVRL